MYSCKEISRLASEALDRKLPLRQRLGLRLHVAMCRFCSEYRRQLLLLREIVQGYGAREEERLLAVNLSPEARERMKALLRREP